MIATAVVEPNSYRRIMNPSDLGIRALVAEDFCNDGWDWGSRRFRVLFRHRFRDSRMLMRPRVLRAPLSVLFRTMFKLCEWLGGNSLPYTVVGRRVELVHFGGMVLLAARIGNDVIFRQSTICGLHRLDDLTVRPAIGNRVEIGTGAALVGHINIGPDAIVSANTVVVDDASEGSVPVLNMHQNSEPMREAGQ